MKLPIFPLPIFLLPGGVTQLRIFEQKYLNMVKNSHKTKGFVIQYQNRAIKQTAKWGSLVDIIDFDQDDNGLLLITVKCRALVDIHDSYQNAQLLLIGHVSPVDFWPSQVINEDNPLYEPLERIFSQSRALSKFYPQMNNDLAWLCARYLEILPVEFKDKESLMPPNALKETEHFIRQLLNIDSNE